MKFCERCKKEFLCGANEESPCWCMDMEVIKVPEIFKDCLCPDCLKLFLKPVESDFYLDENGNTVFTESYHRKRGYCCKSNCRHCPY